MEEYRPKRRVGTAHALAAIAVILAGYAAWHLATSEWPKYKAKEEVRRLLYDPESANFQALGTNQRTGAVCGRVNARNRMGGYVGYRGFLVLDGGAVLFEPPEERSKIPEEELRELRERLAFLKLAKEQCPDGYVRD